MFYQAVWRKHLGPDVECLDRNIACVKFAQGWYKRGVANDVYMPIHTLFIFIFYMYICALSYWFMQCISQKEGMFFVAVFHMRAVYIQGSLI